MENIQENPSLQTFFFIKFFYIKNKAKIEIIAFPKEKMKTS
jgi:hypothetical protein